MTLISKLEILLGLGYSLHKDDDNNAFFLHEPADKEGATKFTQGTRLEPLLEEAFYERFKTLLKVLPYNPRRNQFEKLLRDYNNAQEPVWDGVCRCGSDEDNPCVCK